MPDQIARKLAVEMASSFSDALARIIAVTPQRPTIAGHEKRQKPQETGEDDPCQWEKEGG
jgi:hypothetical protein